MTSGSLEQAIESFRRGNLPEAERLGRAILASDPGHIDALNLLGAVSLRSGDAAAALEHFSAAAKIAPRVPESHVNRGVALQQLKRWDEALASYRRALDLDPMSVDALYNRGVALGELKRWPEALESYDRVLRVRPDHAPAWNNRGNVLQTLERWPEALDSYERLLKLNPRHAQAWSNQGRVLFELNRPRDALKSYERAVALEPRLAEAHWCKSFAHLQLGEFEEGWRLREWRWQTREAPRARGFAQPQWTGQPIAGKTILLYADEGMGDAIHMARYAPLVEQRGAKVILEVHAPLVRLMRSLSPSIEVVAGNAALPAFDWYSPLGSLPFAFGTTLDTIPGREPYLGADPAKAAEWAERLGTRTRPRVGLTWSGNPEHKKDRERTLPFERIRALLDEPIEFHAVQKEFRAGEREAVLADGRMRLWNDQLTDFADTAALVSNLDLVISVDTSVAHTASAIGRPTWFMLMYVADYRWMVDRTDSPWYPSARLFRQPAPGNWAPVLAGVREQLRSLV